MDLVSVESVRESVDEHGDRYLERIYTERELGDCGADPRRLAARFAAKEATIKALRPGRDQPVPWRDVGVRRRADGSVGLELTGRAAGLAADRGVEELALSLSHERDTAAAMVLAR